MITYEYKCTDCSEEFELDKRMSDETSYGDCPSCGLQSPRHFRTVPSIDTYFEGSFKQLNPVPGI